MVFDKPSDTWTYYTQPVPVATQPQQHSSLWNFLMQFHFWSEHFLKLENKTSNFYMCCIHSFECKRNAHTPLFSSTYNSILFLNMSDNILWQFSKFKKQQVFVLTKCWRCSNSHQLISSTHWVHTKLCQSYLFSLYSGFPFPPTNNYYNKMWQFESELQACQTPCQLFIHCWKKISLWCISTLMKL